MTRDGAIPLPDHGVPGGPDFVGGAFYDYDPKYFRDNHSQGLPLARLREVQRHHGCCSQGQSARHGLLRLGCAPLALASTIPTTRLTSVARSKACSTAIPRRWTASHGAVKRMGPLQNIIGGTWSTAAISCFCEHCRAKARGREISAERAQQGYRQLDQLFQAATRDQRPVVGYFVTFSWLLLEYPEILGWEKLWTDSYHEVRSELYGIGKAIAPAKPFGFHIQQNMSFSPFYQAEEDYSRTKDYTDYLKIATYNNAAGPRMATYLDRLRATVFHDASPTNFLQFYYKIMNYQEAPYDRLHTTGLSPDYVARETKRAIAGGGGRVKIYPGIDIDVPTKRTDKRTTPDDVRKSVRAAVARQPLGCRRNSERIVAPSLALSLRGDAI